MLTMLNTTTFPSGFSPNELSILDEILEGFQVIGFDWRYLYLNQAVVRQARCTKEQLLGNKIHEVFPGIENTPLFAEMQRCMEQRIPIQLENQFTYPDGDTAWFDLSIRPCPEGIYILSLDITKHKQAEEQSESRFARLQALHKIDLSISSSTNKQLTLNTIVEVIIEGLKVDAADILLLNPNSSVLEYAAGAGFHPKSIEHSRLLISEGLSGRAVAERKTIQIPDLQHFLANFPKTRLLVKDNFTTYIATPLIARGIINGVLEIYHRSQLHPNQEWLEFLNSLANQTAIAIESATLFDNLYISNLELTKAYNDTIEGWSRAMDLRDKETQGHTSRVTELTLLLARWMGFGENELAHIQRGAMLHDIGKIGIPDHILLKPQELDEEEMALIRRHPQLAYDLLYPVEFLRPALDIPYCHHERWDGSGYPRGLKGEQIPLAARIFAVVDVWDALTSDRPYRKAWPKEKAIQYLREQAGKAFDPQVVELFLNQLI